MDIYCYSFDSEGDKIEENATIRTIEASCFESFRDKLLTLAQSEGFDSDFKQEVVEGHWRDCWLRSYDDIKNINIWDVVPFKPEQLQIRNPGTHPGGNCFWIRPNMPVYTVRYVPEES